MTGVPGTVDELKFITMGNGAQSVMTILTRQAQMSPVGCWVMPRGLKERYRDGSQARTGDKLHKYNTHRDLASCLKGTAYLLK